MANTTIIANNLTVTLQGINLLQDVSFALQANEHLAIIGASGSGKSVLAKVLSGHLFAKGTLQIAFDKQSALQPKVQLVEQRAQLKNLSNVSDFYYQQRFNSFESADALTVLQELQNGTVQPSEAQEKIENWLSQLGMQHRKNAPVIQLSSGEHKRFQLIKALIAPPQILILDSPFVGLDKAARKQLQQIINDTASSGTTIILLTDVHQIPACITHVAVMENGAMVDFQKKENFDVEAAATHKLHHQFNIGSLPAGNLQYDFDNAVSMKNTTVAYGNKTIVQNINWQVQRGDKWLLRGHNGAGKSTLLSLVNGDNPQAYKNEIHLFDKRRGTGESIWDIKQKIGYVSPELHAFFDRSTSCYNAIASGFFDTIGLFKKLTQEQHNIVKKWLDCLNLTSVQNKLLTHLSAGNQRLTLLARALVKDPPLLILDEPCQGLDDEQKENFVNLVNDLCEHLDKTLIYVSHYENEIPPCIDHVLELKNGEQKIYTLQNQLEHTQ